MDAETRPWLLVIHGPQAVGKMTVGQQVSRLTGAPLLYNHMVIDLLTAFFPFGSDAFNRLWTDFFNAILDTRMAEGAPIVTTIGWDLDSEHAAEVIQGWLVAAEQHGAPVYFAELRAPLDVRLERNRHEHRRAHKKLDWATDEALIAMSQGHRFASAGDFPYPNHLALDVSSIPPEESARLIVTHFGLVPSDGVSDS